MYISSSHQAEYTNMMYDSSWKFSWNGLQENMGYNQIMVLFVWKIAAAILKCRRKFQTFVQNVSLFPFPSSQKSQRQ